MSIESIENKVRAIIAEQLNVDSAAATRDASFVGDLGADSLDLAELLIIFEQEFKIRIPADSAREIRSVGSAVTLIEGCKSASNKPAPSA